MYRPTWITCPFAILITLQGAPAKVTWLAREYACVCCIIKVQRNAGVGLVERLDHEKGPSVCWSSRAQRPHIVSLASFGLLYCPSFSHLPFALLHSHAPERGKKVAFHWWVSLEHAQELSEEGSQSAGYNCLSWSGAIPRQPATCMNATEWLITSNTTMKQSGGVRRTNQSTHINVRFIVIV